MKTKLLLFFLLCILAETNAQQKIYDFAEYPWSLEKFNDKIIFKGSEVNTGYELWQSDGTTSNTTLLKDIYPGSESSAINFRDQGAIMNNDFYFIAKDENSKGEIWKTDGTIAGTVKVTSFVNGRTLKLTTVGNMIFFLIHEDDKFQVWKTDGTTDGTLLVRDNLPTWSNAPSFQGKCDDVFIFTFRPYGSNNSRVWRSNGTSDGTFPITSEIDGNGSYETGTSALTQYIEHNNKLYFVSRSFLYETDGTLENTKIMGNVWNAQQKLVQYGTAIEANDNLYFMFFSAELNEVAIWKFDPVNRSVIEIYRKSSPQQYFFPSNFAKIDNSLVFSSSNETGGTSLVSLNLANYAESNLGELSNGLSKPIGFIEMIHAGTILKINDNEYFISSAEQNDLKKGYILDLKLNSLQHISALDNIWGYISYRDNLYYAKDSKLWKYAYSLKTPLVGNKSSLVFYPNPSTDFINIQAENENQVESVQIYDLNGRLVGNKAHLNMDKIDISNLNQGAYILKAKVNGNVISKKILKN